MRRKLIKEDEEEEENYIEEEGRIGGRYRGGRGT